ncbi:hypothetical protein HYO99_gp65 [Roseobacter phage RD-1410W1-01]|uniref:Cell wall hydrolase SleB domain-containing protein n=1 Tax=Roseobacter phage RD-1410W1-01 TaxID=1815984 RepID=A0A191VYL4_9CAUD|nr:hypothetical protein HYO99_gp65 [Roseobacter phage RD-1410W1-01]ANJ20799.1 hypothetical protein RDp01_gp65 [Roseobacter phage RD-1410W1-01]
MADPRLQWRQVAGPDFSGSSAAMAQANDSFNRAFDSAGGILEQYASGQEELADNALLADLAGLGNEAEFDAFVDGGGLNGRGISKSMRDHVLGMRTGFINDDGTRARTASTRAGTGIRLAQEARTASEWQDAVARRDAERSAAGAINDAVEFGREYGEAIGPIESNQSLELLLARTLQAEAGSEGYQGMLDVGSVIRNRAATGRYGEGVEGVIMRPGQFSAWNSVTGYAGGEQGQNMNFTPSEEALRAARTILSGQYEDQTGGATHYVNYNVSQPSWFNNSFQRRGNHWFGFGDGNPGATPVGNTGPIDGSASANTRIAVRDNPRDAVRSQLEETGLFTAAEIDRMLSGVREAEETRTGELEARDREIVAEQSAAGLQSILQDPNITSADQAIAAVLADDRFTATENAQRVDEMLGLINQTGGTEQGSLLNPSAPVTPEGREDEVVAATVNAEIERRQAADPQASAIRQATEWQEDPTASLIDHLRLGSDGQNPGAILGMFGESGFDDNQLRTMIRDTARRNNISESQAAAAMARAFDRDPGWFDGEGNGGWRNTLANRFPEEVVDSYAQQFFGEENYGRGVEGLLQDGTTRGQLNTLRSQIQSLETQLAKAEPGTPQHAAIQAQIDVARTQLNAIRP